MAGQDELLAVNEAAAVLGIRPWTLRHWISDRRIEVVKYGAGAVRIRRSVLDRYLTSCTIKARVRHERRTNESRLLEGASLDPATNRWLVEVRYPDGTRLRKRFRRA